MIKAVLFDFGGVLSQAGKRGSIRDLLGKVYGLDIDVSKAGEAFHKIWRGKISNKEFFAEIKRHYPDSPVVTEQDFIRHMEKFVRSELVYKLAETLRAHGIATGVLSNIFGVSGTALKEGGYYEGFEPVLLSFESGYAKPDPEFYQMAIDKLGVRPGEILFIDDQQYVLDPAKAIGMHTLLATSPEQIVRDTKALIKELNGVSL
jgi:epoxide hydrolase-like predicted phosphatase